MVIKRCTPLHMTLSVGTYEGDGFLVPIEHTPAVIPTTHEYFKCIQWIEYLNICEHYCVSKDLCSNPCVHNRCSRRLAGGHIEQYRINPTNMVRGLLVHPSVVVRRWGSLLVRLPSGFVPLSLLELEKWQQQSS